MKGWPGGRGSDSPDDGRGKKGGLFTVDGWHGRTAVVILGVYEGRRALASLPLIPDRSRACQVFIRRSLSVGREQRRMGTNDSRMVHLSVSTGEERRKSSDDAGQRGCALSWEEVREIALFAIRVVVSRLEPKGHRARLSASLEMLQPAIRLDPGTVSTASIPISHISHRNPALTCQSQRRGLLAECPFP
jgi:hypothetical protein